MTVKNKVNLIGISGKIGSGKDTIAQMIQYLTDVGCNYKTEQVPCFNSYLETLQFDAPTWQIKKFAGKVKQIVSLLTGISVGDLEKPEVKNRILGKEWNRYVITRQYQSAGYDYLYKKYYFTTQDEADSFEDQTSDSAITYEPITVRQLLQQVGTDAMRDVIHPNAWINALFVDYEPLNLRNGLRGIEDRKEANLIYPNWIISDVRFPNELKAIKDRGGIVIRVNRLETFMENKAKSMKDGNYEVHQSEIALDDATFDYIINNDGTLDDLLNKVKYILKTLQMIK